MLENCYADGSFPDDRREFADPLEFAHRKRRRDADSLPNHRDVLQRRSPQGVAHVFLAQNASIARPSAAIDLLPLDCSRIMSAELDVRESTVLKPQESSLAY